MEIIRLIAGFLVTFAVGWNIVFWLFKRDRSFAIPERIAFSYMLGLGVITLEMFFYSLMGVPFSIKWVLLPWIFILPINMYFYHRTAPSGKEPAGSKKTVFDYFLLGGIIFQSLYAFFKAIIRPEDSFDSIGNFAFKAKMFFVEGRVPYDLFMNKAMDIQHVDYPLFVPLSETWMSMFIGSWNDLLVKALFPMFLVALLIVFYYALRRVIGARWALISTFFLATIPHFLNYATIGYADFALIMFYTVSFLYLFLWIAYRRENKYLIAAALFSVLSLWAKNEGALLSLVNIGLLVLFAWLERREMAKNEWFGIAYFVGIICALETAWFIFIHRMGLSNEFINMDTLKLSVFINNLDRIPLVLYDCQKHIFGPKKWNISLLVFTAGFILYFKRSFSGYFKYITLSILLAFLGYSAFYLITPLEIRYHLQTAGSRTLLHFLPIVVFWIGYLGKELELDAESNIHRPGRRHK
ncbi:MAG: glycosyltransferase family 39 protein [Candidatus Omnitrophica bacterium]|nr:glycosyltransferase family 39 protein [Candidatus Omnitrophota bacterium]